MLFKKRKGNPNKIKPSGRKRKIVTTIILSLSLLFGKARLSSSQSPSSNFDNQTIHERVINDRDVNSFEDNDRQVILAKAEGNPITPPTNRGPSNFPISPSGGRPSHPVYVPKYRTVPKVVDQELGAGANPAGASGGGGDAELDDQCPIDEQNKAGIDELPNSSEFIYKLETKTARKALKTVWKNPEAKKEVLAGLDRMNKGELLPRNQKNFKGFKTLKEIKLTDTRMLVQPGQNGGPDQIVAIFMRRDLDNIVSIFKGKYK